MKTSIIAILLLASSAAFANEAADDPAKSAPFVGERTRAEVKAELMAAQQAGTLATSEYASNQMPAFKAERSRFDARVEAVQVARWHAIGEQY
ncbi:MAG: DUF4148 domain-containing protein [Ramlibacter sp.]